MIMLSPSFGLKLGSGSSANSLTWKLIRRGLSLDRRWLRLRLGSKSWWLSAALSRRLARQRAGSPMLQILGMMLWWLG